MFIFFLRLNGSEYCFGYIWNENFMECICNYILKYVLLFIEIYYVKLFNNS